MIGLRRTNKLYLILLRRFNIAHFYTDTGEERHEVPTASKAAKKSMRPSTITDARKNSWLPSATTILDIVGAEGLVTWKLSQYVKFAREIDPECADATALIHAKVSMAKNLKISADGGNVLHKDLEAYVPFWNKGTRDPRRGHWNKMFKDADIVEVLYSERMMASRKIGYAGTGDILGVNSKGQLVVFDLKSKDTNGKVESKKIFKNEKYILQLGCYANLARQDVCLKIKAAIKKGVVSCIAYVSRDELIEVEGLTECRWTRVEMYDEMETLAAGTAYGALFEVWTWLKSYDPRLD